MRIRLDKFIIVLVSVFLYSQVNGQQAMLFNSLSSPQLRNDSARVMLRPGILPGNIYIKKLGFVCRQEWKIEKRVGIPLRIRMGSVEQCDILEGKVHQY